MRIIISKKKDTEKRLNRCGKRTSMGLVSDISSFFAFYSLSVCIFWALAIHPLFLAEIICWYDGVSWKGYKLHFSCTRGCIFFFYRAFWWTLLHQSERENCMSHYVMFQAIGISPMKMEVTLIYHCNLPFQVWEPYALYMTPIFNCYYLSCVSFLDPASLE